ncbi:MAG: hypothetical protein MHM6MM_000424 [Cercozoa sp. M6MM]
MEPKQYADRWPVGLSVFNDEVNYQEGRVEESAQIAGGQEARERVQKSRSEREKREAYLGQHGQNDWEKDREFIDPGEDPAIALKVQQAPLRLLRVEGHHGVPGLYTLALPFTEDTGETRPLETPEEVLETLIRLRAVAHTKPKPKEHEAAHKLGVSVQTFDALTTVARWLNSLPSDIKVLVPKNLKLPRKMEDRAVYGLLGGAKSSDLRRLPAKIISRYLRKRQRDLPDEDSTRQGEQLLEQFRARVAASFEPVRSQIAQLRKRQVTAVDPEQQKPILSAFLSPGVLDEAITLLRFLLASSPKVCKAVVRFSRKQFELRSAVDYLRYLFLTNSKAGSLFPKDMLARNHWRYGFMWLDFVEALLKHVKNDNSEQVQRLKQVLQENLDASKQAAPEEPPAVDVSTSAAPTEDTVSSSATPKASDTDDQPRRELCPDADQPEPKRRKLTASASESQESSSAQPAQEQTSAESEQASQNTDKQTNVSLIDLTSDDRPSTKEQAHGAFESESESGTSATATSATATSATATSPANANVSDFKGPDLDGSIFTA